MKKYTVAKGRKINLCGVKFKEGEILFVSDGHAKALLGSGDILEVKEAPLEFKRPSRT